MSWEMTKVLIASAIRLMLGIWAGKFVEWGLFTPEQADAWLGETTMALLGIILFVIVFGWKWLNARFNILALIKAVQTDPPADTKAEVKVAVADVKAEVKAEHAAVLPL